ncbi:MAG: hypothetical protein ACE5IL_01930 [Myxococcota bacterium]
MHAEARSRDIASRRASRGPTLSSLALAAALLALSPGPASADAWRRDASGICERTWTAGSLLRGPTAIANGIVLPLRSLVGSLLGGPAALATSPIGMAIGTGEGIAWVLVGSLETVTGGTLGVTPETATKLRLSPVLQLPFGARSDSTRVASRPIGCGDG